MVITVRKWLPALLCGAGIAFAGPSGAAEPEAAEALHLPPGETVALPFEPGSYVAASVSGQGGAVTLDLLSGGAHNRRLVAQKSGPERALFMVPQDPALRASGAAARLEIARVVPPAGQGPGVLREVPLTDPLDSPRLQQLSRHLLDGGSTEIFWAERRAEGTPMVEPRPQAGSRRVTFLWRGAQRNVRLWGGPANDHLWLQRLGQSDVWFHTATVPDSLRLSYGLAPDVPQFDGTAREQRVALLATLQADPLNRAPLMPDAPDVFAQSSYLALDNAPPQPGLDGPLPAARGQLEELRFTSEALGNSRLLRFYRPARAEGAPVLLVVFDGESFTSPRAPIPQMLDRLIARGVLPPVHAVFVGNAGGDARSRELPFNESFAQVVAEEIVPLAARHFGITPERERTLLAGASYGGLAAAWIAARQPQSFGGFLALSGSFWAAPEGTEPDNAQPYMASLWQQSGLPPVRAWISAGSYESGREGTGGILETSRALQAALAARGDDTHYREYAGGHDYAVWRGSLTEGLITLLGSGRGGEGPGD